MQNNLKQCTGCLEEKPTSEFHKRKSARDGLSFNCKACKSKVDNEYREKHKERLKENKKVYYIANREKHLKAMKKHYQENHLTYKKKAREWVANNREIHNARCMERYTMKINRCPNWAKELTAIACEEAYDKAKRLQTLTGVPHDVDHIVPLKGKTVSGLHIYSNLQVIPASLNRSKKHYRWPDMWEAV